jgi:hypothetical protein
MRMPVMQRDGSVASTRFLEAQFHETRGRSAAVALGQKGPERVVTRRSN